MCSLRITENANKINLSIENIPIKLINPDILSGCFKLILTIYVILYYIYEYYI